MKIFAGFTASLLAIVVSSGAQIRNDHVHDYPERNRGYSRVELSLPDVGKYKTLTGDFHIHTVFSDGKVWPDVRVNEAWRDGLDVIAITEHLEYRPHKNIVVADHNESYRIAAKKGAELGIIVIPGAEITRKKPVGHINALFIADANLLVQDDPEVAMDEARKQNAVVMLNHPGWPDNHFELSDIQRRWFDQKRFDAVEIYGWLSLYPNAIDLAEHYGTAFMSTSDIHEPIADRFGLGRGARPMTLMFCREHSIDGVREAIENQRTIAYFNDTFVGRKQWMEPFVKSCLSMKEIDKEKSLYQICNSAGLIFEVAIGNDLYVIEPFATVRFRMKSKQPIVLRNCRIGHNTPLIVEAL